MRTKSIKLFGESIAVNAEITILAGTSSHADRDGLISWIRSVSPVPSLVFVNHGDDTVCEDFARSLTEEFQIPASAPYSGSIFDLIEGRYEFLAPPVPISPESRKDSSKAEKVKEKPAFRNLLDALRRLTELIHNGSGRSNGELKKVTVQLNRISDKWEAS